MEHSSAYLVGTILFAAVWLWLFIARRDLRREILTMSVIGSLFTPLALIYLPDYWYPEHIIGHPLGIEDFLFAFFIAGIGGVLYEVIFGTAHVMRAYRARGSRGILAVSVVAAAVLVGLSLIFGLNSIYSSYIAFAVIFFYILWFRRDLLVPSLINGALVGLLMFLFYQVWIALYPGVIQHWWMLKNISGILIAGVPLEEIVWGFSWGIVGGSAYEFVRGMRFGGRRS